MKTDYVARNGTMGLNDKFGKVSWACQNITVIKVQNFSANTVLTEILSVLL